MPAPPPRLARRTAAALAVLAACTTVDVAPDPQALRLPTDAVIAPNGQWLFVVNSNLDEAHTGSTLVSLDLARLAAALARDPLLPGGRTTADRPCRRTRATEALGEMLECEAAWFIDPAHSVELPSGASNIAVDYPAGTEGPMRLLVLSRSEPAVTWIDAVFTEADGLASVDCGQRPRRCADDHVVDSFTASRAAGQALPADPARLYIDPTSPTRFGYIPHLLGSRISLLRLDGARGPELVDIATGFFNENATKFAGGFAIAERPCGPGNAPAATQGCTQPLLYVTQRFWRGFRAFTVSPGRGEFNDDSRLYPARNVSLKGPLPDKGETRPLVGDLAFVDPDGEQLLVVQTTPPALIQIDTSLDPATRAPHDATLRTTPLCQNPNLLTLYLPPSGPRLAFVSCYSEDRVAVVDLGSFTTTQFIAVDDGPNELRVDYEHKKLYVVHTLASTIGAVELDRASVDYLRYAYRIGALSE